MQMVFMEPTQFLVGHLQIHQIQFFQVYKIQVTLIF